MRLPSEVLPVPTPPLTGRDHSHDNLLLDKSHVTAGSAGSQPLPRRNQVDGKEASSTSNADAIEQSDQVYALDDKRSVMYKGTNFSAIFRESYRLSHARTLYERQQYRNNSMDVKQHAQKRKGRDKRTGTITSDVKDDETIYERQASGKLAAETQLQFQMQSHTIIEEMKESSGEENSGNEA